MELENFERVLLLCLKNIVNNSKYEYEKLSAEEIKKLCYVAKKQDLSHLLYPYFEKYRCDCDVTIVKNFDNCKKNAIFRYIAQDQAYLEIQECFTENKIYFMPLKGIVLRKYYPESWMRTSGDIDILIQLGDFSKAKDLLTNVCGFVFEKQDKKDATFTRGTVCLELHFYLIKDESQEEFSTKYIWENAIKDGYCCSMKDEDFYAYHMAHMKHHFETEGCGIRFFLDLWILNHNILFNLEERQKKLKRCRLYKFAVSSERLSEVWFGEKKHSELTKCMESYIFKSGLFGNVENLACIQEIKSGSSIKRVLRRLWLSYDDLYWLYPQLEGKKYLQLYYEIKRFIDMIKDGRWSRTKHELQVNLNYNKEYKKMLGKMLKQLDLLDNEKNK